MSPELIVALLFSVLTILFFGTVVLPRMRGDSPHASEHHSTSGSMGDDRLADARERSCDEARRPSTFR